MAEYTAGPWEWESYEGENPSEQMQLIGCGAVKVVRPGLAEYLDWDDYAIFVKPTDAALIKAAPDMHAALEAQAARDAHRWNCNSCSFWDVECSVAVELEAEAIRLREEALKKARGE